MLTTVSYLKLIILFCNQMVNADIIAFVFNLWLVKTNYELEFYMIGNNNTIIINTKVRLI